MEALFADALEDDSDDDERTAPGMVPPGAVVTDLTRTKDELIKGSLRVRCGLVVWASGASFCNRLALVCVSGVQRAGEDCHE